MTVLARRTIALSCLLFATGCVTDELVVYKESVLSKDARGPFLGVYEVLEWPGEMKPESVRVTETDEELGFSYSLPDKNIQLDFVLSTIPNSKKKLHLMSIPSQQDTNRANMFFIGKAERDETQIWAVFSNSPVAKQQLNFTGGKAKAEDVKAFLVAHADAFVTANKPQVRLRKGKR